MGADVDYEEVTLDGKKIDEVWAELQENRGWEYGHGGYSGTFAEKGGYELYRFRSLNDAELSVLAEIIDDFQFSGVPTNLLISCFRCGGNGKSKHLTKIIPCDGKWEEVQRHKRCDRCYTKYREHWRNPRYTSCEGKGEYVGADACSKCEGEGKRLLNQEDIKELLEKCGNGKYNYTIKKMSDIFHDKWGPVLALTNGNIVIFMGWCSS